MLKTRTYISASLKDNYAPQITPVIRYYKPLLKVWMTINFICCDSLAIITY